MKLFATGAGGGKQRPQKSAAKTPGKGAGKKPAKSPMKSPKSC